ncbi:MAG TPA: prephenate dehydrogenase/arogenate dehydrogenase family protein [Solirubrobacteraceae bacterium]|nr:prephenate dehydrogenase/arogenate dehydrogenase family protein [Solirubrobacteraceae bacterium]
MRIAVVGVGLIGGSIGLAARALGHEVVGFDADARVLVQARERGAVDAGAARLAAALAGADAAFVAAPVGVLPAVVQATLDAAQSGCVVSDVGSTKRTLIAASADERFVGGHPLAGAETAGVRHARAELFRGATWYLTPATGTSGVLYERLHRLLAAFGAQPTAIDAGEHDRVMSSVSHLPHVLANVLVAQAARALGEDAERLPAIGPSFRDATRVAGANGAIWTDIYLANRDALIAGIDDVGARLARVREALLAGDREALASWNEGAAEDRRALLEAGVAGGPVHELRASVPNRPGVIADIALALGRANVNIVDMALSPSAGGTQGVVALWIRGDEQADRACELISGQGIPVARA